MLTKMLMAGYHPQHEPYLASMLQTFRATQLLNLRTKSRIFVPKGGVLMGCLDETSILEYGQVFLQLTLGRENQRFVDDGLEEFNAYYCGNTGILARVITGPVVVAKNPCVHPGDVRVLMAVDEPSVHHMVNCLVFPQNGDRYSMMPIIKSTALKLNNFFLKSRRVEVFYVRKPKCIYKNVGSLYRYHCDAHHQSMPLELNNFFEI